MAGNFPGFPGAQPQQRTDQSSDINPDTFFPNRV